MLSKSKISARVLKTKSKQITFYAQLEVIRLASFEKVFGMFKLIIIFKTNELRYISI